jgi:hypothetical protein
VDHFLSILSNGEPKPASKPDFFEGGGFTDFSLLRVILGYGLPTLAAVALTLVFFHRRDL